MVSLKITFNVQAQGLGSKGMYQPGVFYLL